LSLLLLLLLLPPLSLVPAAEVVAAPNEAEVVIVASVVDRGDMVKVGFIVDKERAVGAVVDEGGVEVEVDGPVMLKWWDWMIAPLANEAVFPASISYSSR
jgi:hypothetical protein